MASMNADIADDPAQRLMISPMETASAWPLFRMLSTVLPTRLSATSSLKMVCRTGDLRVDVVNGGRAEPVGHIPDQAEQGE